MIELKLTSFFVALMEAYLRVTEVKVQLLVLVIQ